MGRRSSGIEGTITTAQESDPRVSKPMHSLPTAVAKTNIHGQWVVQDFVCDGSLHGVKYSPVRLFGSDRPLWRSLKDHFMP
jgi:hypothetical protein